MKDPEVFSVSLWFGLKIFTWQLNQALSRHDILETQLNVHSCLNSSIMLSPSSSVWCFEIMVDIQCSLHLSPQLSNYGFSVKTIQPHRQRPHTWRDLTKHYVYFSFPVKIVSNNARSISVSCITSWSFHHYHSVNPIVN